ncbi:Pre-mRNA-splicing factor CWC25-like protein [Armadillidium nasatum]|uniref:Pre-mRNA-splicing factor CWC25-like protein n=1 Tax=Armadillidium nasatum TaxID=96803 RepID=A0A5N5TMR4_9CRUS|nr:Pre-mRNA-splicing factor CWC25-like protein [Armadillidium nasatum]
MGGGDLNLKKSWHPSTLKNQERVWKAEQQKQEEEKKIAELKQRLKEEQMREELEQTGIKSGKLKKDENSELNWMYKGPSSLVSRESYLLGRKIDKAFEMLEKDELEQETKEEENKSSYTVEHEINPESVIQKDSNNKQVDMKRKLLEDPLLMIRQNEEATKRAITSNPIKMKNLQLLISSMKEKKKKKKKKSKSKTAEAKIKKKKLKEKKKKWIHLNQYGYRVWICLIIELGHCTLTVLNFVCIFG